LKEEPISRSSNPSDVILATSAFGVALLNSFQNIEKKKRAFEGLSIRERWKESLPKKGSLFLPAKKPVPFNRIQKVMWLWSAKGNSKRLWN
jgi:hypothetical protein